MISKFDFGRLVNRLLFLLLLNPFCNAQDTGPEWRHTTRPGENLWDISESHLVQPNKWEQLYKYNRLNVNVKQLPVGTPLRVPARWLRHQPAKATLISVTGQVHVQRPGASRVLAEAAQELAIGTLLQTQANSSALVRFADATTLLLQAESTMLLDTMSVYAGGHMADTRVRLQQGQVEIRANPFNRSDQRFEVITPAAVAAVRGTHFFVQTTALETHEKTIEGLVEVTDTSASKTVLVAAGFRTVIKTGQKPEESTSIEPLVTRALLNPALLLGKKVFKNGKLDVQLPKLEIGQSYLIQIAKDVAGQELLWEKVQTDSLFSIPAPRQSDADIYLFTWLISKPL